MAVKGRKSRLPGEHHTRSEPVRTDTLGGTPGPLSVRRGLEGSQLTPRTTCHRLFEVMGPNEVPRAPELCRRSGYSNGRA